MAFSYDEPIRYNEGKVDWTLLPWDEELVRRIQIAVSDMDFRLLDGNLILNNLLSNNVEALLINTLLLNSKLQNSTLKSILIPWDALEQVCRVFMYGTVKYQRDNYKISPGLPLEGYIQSIWRHTVSYLKGDLLDEDSKLPNLAHIACNAFMYLWTKKEYHNG